MVFFKHNSWFYWLPSVYAITHFVLKLGALKYIIQPRSNGARSLLGCPDFADVRLALQSDGTVYLFNQIL
jgi:hypothetical protein